MVISQSSCEIQPICKIVLGRDRCDQSFTAGIVDEFTGNKPGVGDVVIITEYDFITRGIVPGLKDIFIYITGEEQKVIRVYRAIAEFRLIFVRLINIIS